MLVIKRFSGRKKVFRERKKSRKIRAKRSHFSAGNGAVFIGRISNGHLGAVTAVPGCIWSMSLRCETGEKKLDEVDFISQGVELVSRVPKTMTKSRVEFNLRIGRRMDQRMEVKWI
ncbi:hypothetical protein Tco_0040925 [Tanacetum coccineum]